MAAATLCVYTCQETVLVMQHVYQRVVIWLLCFRGVAQAHMFADACYKLVYNVEVDCTCMNMQCACCVFGRVCRCVQLQVHAGICSCL